MPNTPDSIRDDIIAIGKMLVPLKEDFLTMQDRSLEANRLQGQVEADLLALSGKIEKLEKLLRMFSNKVEDHFRLAQGELLSGE